MKYRLKVCTLAALVISLFMQTGFYAQAGDINSMIECQHGFSTFNDHVLNGGVGSYGNARRYYWIHPDINHLYGSQFRTAVNNWVYTTDNYPYYTTSISLRETTTKSSATIEFHNVYDRYREVYAFTDLRLYRDYVDPTAQNWGWAEVFTNQYMIELYQLSNNDVIGTLGHELGHCMGLAHCPDTRRLMSLLEAGRSTHLPHVYDCQTVYHLYN
ncbi:MAG: hypothetical protein HFE86_07250 [Clostridiales bacterium]|nr:hypothetical protein [Clostridiales bacterium]